MKRIGLRPLAAALLVVALTLLFFWKLVFTNLVLVGVDSFLYFYPYKSYVAQALRAGRFPLWNPYLFMGAPLFANMQTAVLYPLHWPFLWLPAPRQVAASIVLHVALAGLGTLAYARRSLNLGWPGSLTAAVIFALGGFVGAQAEHVNQLNVIAWLPWTFLLLDISAGRGRHVGLPLPGLRRRVVPTLGLGLVMALMILAGHAQATYISLAGLGLYTIAGSRQRAAGGRFLTFRLLVFVTAVAVAVLLAAVQLLPTLELSRLSVRSGGLSYREVISFSLRPWLLHFTLLPPFGIDLSQVFGEAYSEYVAYVGVTGLGLAAVGGVRGWRRPGTRIFLLLAAVGLFLGLGGFNPIYFLLYKIVPGFDLFRAPARWMLLYAFGTALLAGIGVERIGESANRRIGKHQPHHRCGSANRLISKSTSQRISNLPSLILPALVCVELFLAGRGLRYNQPTAPEAFTFLRPSIAHLKTDPGRHRFLSLSGIVYDPGDLAEMRAIFAGQLPERAIYDYVVAAKEKEVLFYNLPLLYGLYSVDGYDGGLLPLRNFVTMERLFLDDEHLSVDGRLRDNLHDVPPGRLLSLLGVKYLITDKVFDVWIDGVFYDLQFSARLGPDGPTGVGTSDLPAFPTTALGIVSHLEGAGSLPDGTPVAQITVADETGWSSTFDLLAGRDTSEGRYGDGVAHRQARVGHTWRDDPTGSDYITLIPLDGPRRLTAISVVGVAPAGEFVLRGLSLVDTRTTTSRQVTLSTEGRYRLVHSGDVKIYENLDVLPRAFVVHRAEVIPDDDRAIARLRDPAFDPAQTVVLADEDSQRIEQIEQNERSFSLPGLLPQRGPTEEMASADIVRYAPEEVVVDATTDAPGYLLLTDAFYPGWQVTVDGQPAEILRADVLFRAVWLEPGTHRVEFRYRPASVRWGGWVSGATLLLLVFGALVASFPSRKSRPNSQPLTRPQNSNEVLA